MNGYYYLFPYSEAGKGHIHYLPDLPLRAVAGHHHCPQVRIIEGDGRGGRAVQSMQRHARATGARPSTITREPRRSPGAGGAGYGGGDGGGDGDGVDDMGGHLQATCSCNSDRSTASPHHISKIFPFI